eukprot:GHVU01206240.1.p3 GENE.GHVU01206240.1~~GHVU01206240.1.p3  ORF type:complete len:101 (+),score=17.43 GHVU01206240.1:549-851(+)
MMLQHTLRESRLLRLDVAGAGGPVEPPEALLCGLAAAEWLPVLTKPFVHDAHVRYGRFHSLHTEHTHAHHPGTADGIDQYIDGHDGYETADDDDRMTMIE